MQENARNDEEIKANALIESERPESTTYEHGIHSGVEIVLETTRFKSASVNGLDKKAFIPASVACGCPIRSEFAEMPTIGIGGRARVSARCASGRPDSTDAECDCVPVAGVLSTAQDSKGSATPGKTLRSDSRARYRRTISNPSMIC